jgi:DNA-binding IclR family transcriptional regulator
VPEISKTADNALRVLVQLAESGPTSAAQLSRSLRLTRTAAARLLATLHARGFVSRDATGLYQLGAVLAWLGQRTQPLIRAAALPAMERLSRQTGETIVLWILDGPGAVATDQVVGDINLVRVQYPVGSRAPLHVASSGRILLAFQDPDVVERAIRAAPEPEALRELLAEARRLGYSVSQGELQPDVHGVAAPILGPGGRAVAALALIAPGVRAPAVETHVGGLLETVREIGEALRNEPAEP